MTAEGAPKPVAGALLKIDRARAVQDPDEVYELLGEARNDLRWVRDFLMEVVEPAGEQGGRT